MLNETRLENPATDNQVRENQVRQVEENEYLDTKQKEKGCDRKLDDREDATRDRGVNKR